MHQGWYLCVRVNTVGRPLYGRAFHRVPSCLVGLLRTTGVDLFPIVDSLSGVGLPFHCDTTVTEDTFTSFRVYSHLELSPTRLLLPVREQCIRRAILVDKVERRKI